MSLVLPLLPACALPHALSPRLPNADCMRLDALACRAAAEGLGVGGSGGALGVPQTPVLLETSSNGWPVTYGPYT